MVTLEDQLATLAEVGLSLSPAATVDDLLYSHKREAFEGRPYSLLLFAFGSDVEREPWGRNFCSSVWNFDTECITGAGDYVLIAKRLCELAGRPDALANLRDHVDLEEREAWIEYAVDGKQRRWDIEVQDDWADMMTVAYIMGDLERDGRMFRAADNGQALLLFYLDRATMERLAKLTNVSLRTVTDP